ncbi:GNAT family N-acetyltransferase [Niallia sp. Krafla_26]|uniref:GNAT family N-acetyltransferase n=1 Tax=Niallia sp. Krafla_26 TaxID=3064703 RepID=UPI003D16D553
MIREANSEDKREAAILIYDAILDIAHSLTGETERDQVLESLEFLFSRKENRLSFENCLVKELEGKVVGLVLTYPGKDAEKLDEEIKQYLKGKKGQTPVIDKEADETDFYIDTVSVNPKYRGKKIGTRLLEASFSEAKQAGYKTVSLLVEENNVNARKLYHNLGFRYKKTVSVHHHIYDYLIREVD